VPLRRPAQPREIFLRNASFPNSVWERSCPGNSVAHAAKQSFEDKVIPKQSLGTRELLLRSFPSAKALGYFRRPRPWQGRRVAAFASGYENRAQRAIPSRLTTALMNF
jgi:hypothetical protein